MGVGEIRLVLHKRGEKTMKFWGRCGRKEFARIEGRRKEVSQEA